MATLISPGVSVTVTDESFFFPASATTVPLIFLATRANKMQSDDVTTAAGQKTAVGTQEYGVVRTVTSLSQSIALYGVPYFRKDVAGNEFHGDARNEYGLMALNDFLAVGSRAYVVRANVDLNDDTVTFMSLGTPIASTPTFTGVGNGTISTPAVTSSTVQPQTVTVTFTSATDYTVYGTVSGHIGSGTTTATFTSTIVSFTVTANTSLSGIPFVPGDKFTFALSYAATPSSSNTGNGTVNNLVPDLNCVNETITITFTSSTAYTVSNMFGSPASGTVGSPFDDNRLNFTISAGTVPFVAGDEFTIVASQVSVSNPLGATDAARRVTIVQALQASINSNVDVRSEMYEYNLILCPGYWECVDEMLSLSTTILEEAFVLADTPPTLNPEQTASWSLTSARKRSANVAYYYPWAIQSNLNGRDVMTAPSGVALRTLTQSDNASYVWFAPAGVSRGLVNGVSTIGYVTGTLGTATTFVEASLNLGQRDALYEYDKNVNPIVYFPGRGILIWGQKTSYSAASALDRVNVVRMIMYLRRTLRKGAMPFVFEPNDQITRDNLKAAADGFMTDIVNKRGMYEFASLCDESNNDAARIDANELHLDIAVKPTKAAEFLYIPIRVVNTGESI